MRALLLPALLMTLSVASTQSKDPLRLGREVTPTFQSIHVTVDPRHHEFSGQTTIELAVHQTVSQFRFHARDMQLDRVVLHGVAGAVEVTHESSAEKGLVTAKTAHPLAPGVYTLEIDFSAKFNTQAASLYRMETGGAAYAFTQFESDDARGAFPCWDEPEFKYPFQITLTVPRSDLAVTNTPIEKETVQETVGGEYKIVVFKKTPPMPTYLLAIAVGPLEAVPVPDLHGFGRDIPGRVIAPKGQAAVTAEAVKVSAPILSALEKYFGRPYPYEKLDQIAVPEFWPGAMENAGLVTYADSILLVDSRAASVVQKRNLVAVMAHELSHMWFGDLVTMEWWDDLWLNESFASWMGDKITHQLYPELSIDTEEIAGADRAMLTDAKPSTRAIRQPVSANENFLQTADELAYQKGQRVLGMFERWIGPEKFRQGVIDYLKAHEWKNAAAADLWKALGAAAGKDITTPMTTFLDQGGVPLVSVEPAKGGIILRQHRFLNYGVNAPAASWQIPVVLKFSAGGPKTVLLTGAEQFVPLEGVPAWVHPNAGEAGYYRWKVPAAMLVSMTEKGNGLPGLTHLDVRERVGLINNVSALLDAGEIHGDEYLRVLGRFAGDEAPQVINSLLNGLTKVENAFVIEELEEAYAAYLRKTLGPALQRWGLVKKAGEPEAVSFLRPRLLYRLANEGRDATLMAAAQELARDYARDPASIDPALATNALRLAAMRGDAGLFDEYRKRFETTQIPADRQRYLLSLGEFRDVALVARALAYTLDSKTRPQEVLTIPSVISDGDLKNEDLPFRWMTSNYAAIVKRIPPDVAAFLPQFADGCSEERLERAKAFFADPAHQVEGTQKELAKVADTVTNCVSLRKREGAAVAEFLRKN